MYKFINISNGKILIAKNKINWNTNIKLNIPQNTFAYGSCILYLLLGKNVDCINLYYDNLTDDEILTEINLIKNKTIIDNKLYYDKFEITLISNYKTQDYLKNTKIDCEGIIYKNDTITGNYNFTKIIETNTINYNNDYQKYYELGFNIFINDNDEKFIFPLCKCNNILMAINSKKYVDITYFDNKIIKAIFKYGTPEIGKFLKFYDPKYIKLTIMFDNIKFFNYIIKRDGHKKFLKYINCNKSKKWINILNILDIQYEYINYYYSLIKNKLKKFNNYKLFNQTQFKIFYRLKIILNNLENDENLKKISKINNIIPNIETLKYIQKLKINNNQVVFNINNICFTDNLIKVIYDNFTVEYTNVNKQIINYCVNNDIYDITKYICNFNIVHPSWIDKLNDLSFECIIKTLFSYTDIDKLNNYYNNNKLLFVINNDFIMNIIAEFDYVYILYYFLNYTNLKINDIIFFIKNKSVKCFILLTKTNIDIYINDIIYYGSPEMLFIYDIELSDLNDKLICYIFETVKNCNSEMFNYLYTKTNKNLSIIFDNNNFTIYHYICKNNINTNIIIVETENIDGITPSDLLNEDIYYNYCFGEFIIYDDSAVTAMSTGL